MANYHHVEILKRGVDHWNQWRAQGPDIKPNLSGTNLMQADLQHANLKQTDLRKADLRKANLEQADLTKTDLRNANLRGVCLADSDLRAANMSGANFITADLSKADLSGADLRRVNLSGADLNQSRLNNANLNAAVARKAHMRACSLNAACLRGADLSDTVFAQADLGGADLSLSELTGAHLYGTARDEWKIDGIKCAHVYWDEAAQTRTPEDRSFTPGEFEQRYRRLPTIEFFFEQGFSPIEALLIERVVTTIRQERPELELRLDSYMLHRKPRAVFSVLHKEHSQTALALINAIYAAQEKEKEGKFREWMEASNCSRDK